MKNEALQKALLDMKKRKVDVVKNGKVIKNVPCYVDKNGEKHFSIPTVCKLKSIQ